MQVIAHWKHVYNIAEPERWASLIAGSALAVIGISRRSRIGTALALAGAELLRRGVTGHSYLYELLGFRTAGKGQGAKTTAVPYELGVRVDHSITIARPRAEVYRFWLNLENLPSFMKHLQSVTRTGPRRSHWVVQGPANKTVEWDAEIHNAVGNELISWRSLPGAEVDVAGSVLFQDAPGGGTEVFVELQYNPPGGILGAFAAKMWGEEPSQQIAEDLRRLKQMMESGEVRAAEERPRRDDVETASEESFPASDAPAWRL